jgi:general secretion pathway protein E
MELIYDVLPQFQGVDLYPDIPEDVNIALAIKSKLLFAKVEETLYAFTCKEWFPPASGYLNKINTHASLALLDIDSYERLYHRYLELKTDKEFSVGLKSQDKEFIEDDEDIKEFLRTSSDILTSEESAPIIKFVNSLFYQAVKRGASDIHIETHENRGIVRFRIDGVMNKHIDLEAKVISLVISRIKIISNLDIAEKRIPQDGRTQIKIAGRNLDVRVSTLPTYNGERAVLRILMESSKIPTLEELGFSSSLTDQFKALLLHTHGMILVTGSTGSGKSTTLHAFLQTIASPEKNIITVEDPVEYISESINQIQVNTKAGLTFASGLRSILRQDPDVIMVGEIRDQETAKIAIQAALTGHLLLSTLHTNTTTATITRLIDMGIEDYLISSCLLGVLSQRLVRKLCPHCKEQEKINTLTCKELSLNENLMYYKSKGCATCNFTGYLGRQAVGELFILDEQAKVLITQGASDFELRKMLQQKKQKLLSTSLKELLEDGITSLFEVIRVGIKEI